MTTTYRGPQGHPDGGVVYTPDLAPGVTYPGELMEDGRALMRVSVEDAFRISEANPTATDRRLRPTSTRITDLATGTDWIVRPSACGAGCFCGATATPAPPTTSTGPARDE